MPERQTPFGVAELCFRGRNSCPVRGCVEASPCPMHHVAVHSTRGGFTYVYDQPSRNLLWTDADDQERRRYVVKGEVYDYPQQEQRQIPIMDAELLARLRKLGADREWVFQSRNGTPVNTCNVRKRFLKPVAKELGIEICGWHDFRHSLNREMRRNGVDPKVRSGALGHKKVNLAMDVYDRCSLEDLEQALGSTVTQLLPSCDPDVSVQ